MDSVENVVRQTYNYAVDNERKFLDATLTSMNTAFALAAALAWNEAIKKVVSNFTPKGSGHVQLIAYASLVTLLYVVFLNTTKRSQKDVSLVAKIA